MRETTYEKIARQAARRRKLKIAVIAVCIVVLTIIGARVGAFYIQHPAYDVDSVPAYADKAPHRLCSYIYELANDLNTFYHENRILAEEDASRQQSWIALLVLVRRILLDAIDVLGFSAPERM